MRRFRLFLLVLLLCIVVPFSVGQSPTADQKKFFETSNCMGCHGKNGMGGMGPPLAQTKLMYEKFKQVVRDGKGMMPAIPATEVPDEELEAMYHEVKKLPWREDQVPIAYKVGQFLSPRNVSHIFLAAFGFFFIFALRGIAYWLKCAGFSQLWPYLRKLGILKTAWIALKSFVIDGFLVGSLWKSNKFRWFMHGLMLYGFCGLILADILMAIYNPERSQLPFNSPLKLLPVLSGIAVTIGICYVMYRYKKDEYIDNGLTLGKDFLFVSLLFHTLISGFLVVTLKRLGVHDWVMTIYIYHLSAIFLLVVTGPFTRFQHIYVVPVMAALTRLTEAVVEQGAGIGFEREPSPGRHHKSQKIAEDLMTQLDPNFDAPITLRYYP